MVQIIVATNRLDSRSNLVAKNVQKKFKNLSVESEVMNLSEISWSDLDHNLYGAENVPPSMEPLIAKINDSDGLYVVCPEYNGSFPGAVKIFMDYWDYPASFEKKPVCFTGLGGMFGGLRPVEHLQQVFGYRNAFMYPERVFMRDVWNFLSVEGEIQDEVVEDLVKNQVEGFSKFIKALKSEGLHCHS